ncbi:DUF5367 family protein [Flammeovirgaceae bacterium SG7u.111]|nr:DUF5367 family protein [Flammeovirgaceae bacterium SG7u.132]WPO33128.1 DUF5367 family protein [Flammeovirgaceae bacterium SG7u.111]
MDIKRLILAAVVAWCLGVSAYSCSYLFTLLNDPEMQANIILTIALIPSAIIGARFYYAKEEVNGFKLGSMMFLVTMCLDALITVPLLIIPSGGSYLSFFSDLGFWLIAVEYILVVGTYSAYLARSRKRQVF